MILGLPLKFINVTQPFGVNYVDFYQKLGLKGHNGIDFRAYNGCDVFSMSDGVVTFAGMDGDGGISVTVTNGNGYKINYYHLKDVSVKAGDFVLKGAKVGRADNTGKYTTGDHLHITLKFINGGKTLNVDNGYKGAVDPSIYLPKGWNLTPAYNRYGVKADYLAELNMRFKNIWLHKKLRAIGRLKLIYNTEFINKLVYGGWSFEEAMNESMDLIANYVKKDDFQNGIVPFK